MKRETAGVILASFRVAAAAEGRVSRQLRIAVLALAAAGTALAALCNGGARANAWESAVMLPAPIVHAGDEAALSAPKILSPEDVLRYQSIFALQSGGRWAAADREIARLGNRLLMGHVLHQRYLHPTKYRSQYRELKHWLDDFSDHPEADRIYGLALRRQPAEAPPPQQPIAPKTKWNFADVDSDTAPIYRPERVRSPEEMARVNEIKDRIDELLRAESPAVAMALLSRTSTRALLDSVEYDELRTRIAAALFFLGDDAKALALASASAEASREHVTTADWIAGLAAWRQVDYRTAQKHFAALAQSAAASRWDAAAGAYWAARSYLVDRQPKRVSAMLSIGAKHSSTFYGLLSSRLLDRDLRLNFEAPPLSSTDLARIMRINGVRRAIALAQVGQHELADQELINVYLHANASLGGPLLGLAYRLDLPETQLRLARGLRNSAGEPYHAALFPIPPWQPETGYSIDRALLYALMRQESAFNAKATSPVGARGLMQLMPSTASYVAGDDSLLGPGMAQLYSPTLNLELGQRYIERLIRDAGVGSDLFRLSAAYNGGPGNLQKWLKQSNFQEDPLLFIESIPNAQTRRYVERVLTNFWIYRARLGQDSPSLDAVAAGRWPSYSPLDAADVVDVRHAWD